MTQCFFLFRQGSVPSAIRWRKLLSIIGTALCIKSLHDQMTKKYVGTFYPTQCMQSFNEDLFFKSFRSEHFYQELTAMQQVGNKSILCGRMVASIRNRGSMFFRRCLGFFPCLKNKSCRLSERADMREPALCHCSVIDSQCDPSSYLTGARSAHSHAQRIDLASARWPANVLRASSLRDRWPARPVGIQRATSPAHLPAQRASACRPPRPAALYGSEYAADSRTF